MSFIAHNRRVLAKYEQRLKEIEHGHYLEYELERRVLADKIERLKRLLKEASDDV